MLLRRKQLVLAALSRALNRELRARQYPSELVKAIVDVIQAQADQFRLMIDGGWPWETVQTEHKIYGLFHPEASLLHRVFKNITLLAAAAMPPKLYYAAQHSLSKSNFYLRARSRWLPFPAMPHLEHGMNVVTRPADEHREDIRD